MINNPILRISEQNKSVESREGDVHVFKAGKAFFPEPEAIKLKGLLGRDGVAARRIGSFEHRDHGR